VYTSPKKYTLKTNFQRRSRPPPPTFFSHSRGAISVVAPIVVSFAEIAEVAATFA
jgi:hypothetical protein